MPETDIAAVIGASASTEPVYAGGLAEELKAKLDKVDLLLADLGSLTEFRTNSSEYVTEAKTELAWNRRLRALTVVVTLVLVIALAVLFYLAILQTGQTNQAVNATTLTAIAVGCISGVVVLTIAVTRSTFASVGERNAAFPMPEHLNVLLELLKTLTSK